MGCVSWSRVTIPETMPGLVGAPTRGLGVVLTARGVDLHVPALSGVEMVSALRGLVLRRLLSPERAEEALDDYLDLPLVRHGHLPLLRRAFHLRSHFSACDATYVALAEALGEALGAALCTADDRLAATVRVHTGLALSG